MTLSRREYIDIIHSYISLGQSQEDIASKLDLGQSFVSTVLKSYGINEKNYEKWGKNTDRGLFPNLTSQDIAEFVDSGSKSFYTWYENYSDNSLDDTTNKASLLQNAISFADNIFNSSDNVGKSDNNSYSVDTDDNQSSTNSSSDSSALIILGIILITVGFLYKSVAEFVTNIPNYLDILIQGDYILFLIVALVSITLALKWFLGETLKFIVRHMFLLPLGISIILTGIKFYMDLGDTSLPFCFIVIGMLMLLYIYKEYRR